MRLLGCVKLRHKYWLVVKVRIEVLVDFLTSIDEGVVLVVNGVNKGLNWSDFVDKVYEKFYKPQITTPEM